MSIPAEPVAIERLLAPVTLVDRAAIVALETASFSTPWTPEAFDSMLQSPVAQIYVVRNPHAGIVAFCACWVIDDEVHINTVAVAEAFRRRGIALALMREVLKRTNARTATLEVRRSNAAAIALYTKLGFTITAERPRYYKNPEEDALILWLNP